MSLFVKDNQHIYRAEPFSAFPWLEHGFGTRHATLWSADPRLASLRQIHSDVCFETDGRAGCLGEGDALTTAAPGVLLSVRTADCVPLLLVDEHVRAVAAVHAGWRGTVAGIAGKVAGELRRRFSSRPEDLHAAIGPGIGACCYEVGAEVAFRFQELFPERTDLGGKARIDLAEANRRQLIQAGVAAERIYTAALCTSCRLEEFHSWRRDHQTTGRMLSAVGILP